MKAPLISLLTLACLALPISAADPIETVLFQQEKDGYNNIRIPAICKTVDGTLLAFAEGREAGDAGNIDLILRRSTDDGQTWSDLQVVWDDGENTCGNPAPVVDRDTGTIWLLLTWNKGSDSETKIMTGESEFPRKAFVTHSKDDGLTWAEPTELPHLRKENWRWYATGPCNGIQLQGGPNMGRLIIPANHSDGVTEKRDSSTYHSHVIYSDDHGESWELAGIQEPRTNESTVVELLGGKVMQNMRSYHGEGCRAVAISEDGGETFGSVYLEEELQTPVCQASILRYSWGEHDGDRSRLLFSSPMGSKREKMTIWASHDEGSTWPVKKIIHEGPAAYSNLIRLADDRVGLLYEKGVDGPYETITFATFDSAWLE